MSDNSEILGYLNNISNILNIENQDLLQLKEYQSELLKKINDLIHSLKSIDTKFHSLNYNLGQYFTTNIELKEKVFEFILNKPSIILEPSIGQGDLITYITDKIISITFDMYEIDPKIKLLDKIQKDNVIYGDFMKQTITKNIYSSFRLF